MVGRLAKPKPSSQRNAMCMFDRHIREIKHDRRKAAGLQK
jgi:hypothetical protein